MIKKNSDQVYSYVERQIHRLQALPPHPQKAMLAKLRRGVGKDPGELPELWGIFLQELPEELMSKTGQPTAAEWAIYVSLTMFALHQQGRERSMNSEEMKFGQAVRLLAEPGQEPQEGSAYRRFSALVTAQSLLEISQHLRGIIQLLRQKEIPLNYPALAKDLFLLQFPSSAPQVKLRWGQDYYYIPQEKENNKNKETDNHE